MFKKIIRTPIPNTMFRPGVGVYPYNPSYMRSIKMRITVMPDPI
jgi:hypothetical protein